VSQYTFVGPIKASPKRPGLWCFKMVQVGEPNTRYAGTKSLNLEYKSKEAARDSRNALLDIENSFRVSNEKLLSAIVHVSE
jgi:hypothetical protein